MVQKNKKWFLLGADHAGFKVKTQVEKLLLELKVPYQDFSPELIEGDDYPDVAKLVAKDVSKSKKKFGLLVCGTGIGMSITANKTRGVRAALCMNEKQVILSRKHNDANILVLGNYVYKKVELKNMLKKFLETEFEGGRHLKRINKIKKLEK